MAHGDKGRIGNDLLPDQEDHQPDHNQHPAQQIALMQFCARNPITPGKSFTLLHIRHALLVTKFLSENKEGRRDVGSDAP